MKKIVQINTVVLALSLLLSTDAWGFGNDGHTLKEQCAVAVAAMQGEQDVDRNAINMCVGRLSRIMNLQTFYCIPEGTPLDNIIKNLHDWLEAHPERLDENASALAIEAFTEAYPCSEEQLPG